MLTTLNFSYNFLLMPFQKKNSTLAKYYIKHFFMEDLKLSFSQPC